MSRRIITTQLHAAGTPAKADQYFDRVVKYIPGDVVAAWLFISTLVREQDVAAVLMWIMFAAGIALTVLWTWRQTAQPDRPPAFTQILVATVAFGVWVFALGWPFDTYQVYESWFATVVLVVFTVAIGAILPRE